MAELEDADLTFAPAVNPNSRRIAQARRCRIPDPIPIPIPILLTQIPLHPFQALEASGERLPVRMQAEQSFGSAKAAAAALAAAGGWAAGDGECTFAPALSANTQRIVASMDAAGRPADFVARQAAYQEAAERKRTAREGGEAPRPRAREAGDREG